jgi:hypothetical protein
MADLCISFNEEYPLRILGFAAKTTQRTNIIHTLLTQGLGIMLNLMSSTNPATISFKRQPPQSMFH